MKTMLTWRIAAFFAVMLAVDCVYADTFTVSSTSDSGLGSLRAAITDLNASGTGTNTIEFTVASGSTITLASSLPAITKAGTLTITGGPSAAYCTIDGVDLYSIVRITSATDVSISGLTLTNGLAVPSTTSVFNGGAVYFSATAKTLTLTNCAFNSNSAIYSTGSGTLDAYGGAVSTRGPLTASNCTFDSNLAKSTAGSAVDPRGGAIYCNNIMTLTDCSFTGNTAEVAVNGSAGDPTGGAVDVVGTSTLTRCQFTSNTVITASTSTTSTPKGGAFFGDDTTLDHCTFTGNSATSARAGGSVFGGAAEVIGDAYTVANCTFSNNACTVTATGASQATGGALHISPSSGTAVGAIADTTFVGNQATVPNTTDTGAGVSAGGCIILGGTANIYRSIFRNNVTSSGGGEARAAALRGAPNTLSVTLNVFDSEFSGNSCVSTGAGTAVGGAVACYGIGNTGITGTLTLANSTIYGNTASSVSGASYGGGVYTGSVVNVPTTLNLRNCTIAANTCTAPTAQGGGIMPKVGSASSTVNLSNSIIAGNTCASYPDIAPATTIASTGYSLIGDVGALDFSGNNNDLYGDPLGTTTANAGSTEFAAAIDAKLSALANNGGLSKTCALQYDSPAINGGDPAYSGPLSNDQRVTTPRIRGGRLDIGAYAAPTRLLSIARADAASNNLTAVHYTATFDSAVSGLSTSNFSAASTLSGTSVASVSGGPSVYTVEVASGSGEGTISLTMNTATGVSSDGVSELLGVPITGASYTVDTVAPTLSALTPDNAGPVTPATMVTFPAHFSENVTDFTAADVTVNYAGTSNGTVGITGGPQDFNITVSGVSGTGSYTITVGTGVTDGLGNALAAPATSGSVSTIDTSAVDGWSELEP